MSEPDDYSTRIPLPEGFDESNALVVSSTQFDTFELCQRKWWFRFVQDMPQPEQGALTFGTTLHAVCERFLRADHLGRADDGEPVDLYPEGWDKDVSPSEAALIQRLVAEAISEGILERLPRREVEHNFIRPLIEKDGITVFVRGSVDLQIPPDTIEDHKTTKDMAYAKSPAKLADANQPLVYAWNMVESLSEIGRPIPTVFRIAHNVFCKDDSNGLKVRKTWAKLKGASEDGVPLAKVVERMNQLKVVALAMLETKQTFTEDSDWRRLPDPSNFARACGAYGGCPYRPICGGRETPERFRKRLTLFKENQERKDREMTSKIDGLVAAAKGNGKVPPASAKPPAVNGGAPVKLPVVAKQPTVNNTTVMSEAKKPIPRPLPTAVAKPKPVEKFFVLDEKGDTVLEMTRDVLEKYIEGGYQSGSPCHNGDGEWKTCADFGFKPGPNEEPAAEEAPAEEVAEEPAAEEAAEAPPWADPKCKACAGTGFNTRGDACRICDSLAAKANKITSAQFTISAVDGRVVWSAKEQAKASPKTAPKPPAPKPAAKAPASIAAQAQAALKEAEEADPEAHGIEEAPAAATGEESEGDEIDVDKQALSAVIHRGRGRPRKGFTLLINAALMKVTTQVIDLTEFLCRYGDLLAEKSKVASYYDLHPFERRDAVCALVKSMVPELGTAYVVANGHSPDLRALVDAIRPYAANVIEGVVFVPGEMATGLVTTASA